MKLFIIALLLINGTGIAHASTESFDDEDAYADVEMSDDADFDEAHRYPEPPWSRTAWAAGQTLNKFSAQSLCRSDASSKVSNLGSTCRRYGGKASSSVASCTVCQKLGSQWRCSEGVIVRCAKP